jgi:hypothetical protein
MLRSDVHKLVNSVCSKEEVPEQWKESGGFEVLTASNMKMAVFWVVTLCSLVEVYRRFRGTCCLHHQLKLLPDYTTLQSRRQPSVVISVHKKNEKTDCNNYRGISLLFTAYRMLTIQHSSVRVHFMRRRNYL